MDTHHKDHRQRKRDQFYHHGSDAFADHELLELLLFYGIARKDVNPIAHALIAEFGSLEAVLARAEEIAKPSIRESIMCHAERLRINYRLIKLDTGAALPFSVQEMAYCGSGMSTRDVLRGIGLL